VRKRERERQREKHSSLNILFKFELQWKPLNVITLGQRESDKIIRQITISQSLSCIKLLKHLTESDLGLGKSRSI
jgi:hypothetical protein